MPDRDEKKRASLRGRGWEIMRGQSGPSGPNDDDSVAPTPEETSELFAIGGSIGLNEPENVTFEDSNIPPLPDDFADYELELLSLDEEELTQPAEAIPVPANPNWDWIETSYDAAPYDHATTEIPSSLDTEEIGSTDALFASLGVMDTTSDAPDVVVEEAVYDSDVNVRQAPETAAFQALMNTPATLPPAPRTVTPEAALGFEDSSVFEGSVNLGALDDNLDELSRDLASTLQTGASQAIPIPVPRADVAVIEAVPLVESKSGEPIVLRGQMKFVEAESLIPIEPEVVDKALIAPDNRPKRAVATTSSEGVLLQQHQRSTRTDVVLEEPPSLDLPEEMPELPAEIAAEDEAGGGIGAVDLADIITFDDDNFVDSPFDDDQRPSIDELFALAGPDAPSDPELLSQLIDEDALQALWSAIENLQAEIAATSWLSRKRADTYQSELLSASNLLLESRENYDEARAILYRVRGDLKRDERAKEEIEEFAPKLRRLILLWFGVVLVLAFLSGTLEDVLEDADAHFLAAAFVPMLFGIAGRLFLAYTTLNRHTAVLRDFDRTHVGWYRFAPIIGALMGFLVYVLWVATVVTSTSQSISDLEDLQYPAVVWILAFLGGLQQNWVINRLRALRDGNKTSAPAG